MIKKFLIIIIILIIGFALIAKMVEYLVYGNYQGKEFQHLPTIDILLQDLIPDKDGNYYNDNCFGVKECSVCKVKSFCLECMDRCFNRFGDYLDANNKFQNKAINCIEKCWKAKPKLSPDNLFDIEPIGK